MLSYVYSYFPFHLLVQIVKFSARDLVIMELLGWICILI